MISKRSYGYPTLDPDDDIKALNRLDMMELREWLIILGLILMAVIVIDGVRRLQRQRQSSRSDAKQAAQQEKSDAATARETAWELPNGGARVISEATVQAPSRTPSAFERHGLKTRLQEQEVTTASAERQSPPASVESPAVPAAKRHPPAADDLPSDIDPVSSSGSMEKQATLTDDVALTTTAQDEPNGDRQPMTAAAHSLRTDDHEAVDDGATTASQPEATNDVSSAENDALPTDSEQELTPEPFDPPEEEEVDDPRYEGLSEILWRRPLDGLAHLKEVMSARRVEKEKAREAARLRRLETRERRAQQKVQQREEKDAQWEQQRQQEVRHQRATAVAIEAADPLAALEEEDPLFNTSKARRQGEQRHRQMEDHSYRYSDDEVVGSDSNEMDDVSDEAFDTSESSMASGLHPDIERAYRHLVNGTQARETLGAADEVMAIAVMARAGETFDGLTLLQLMLACGLRYCPTTRVFHRFETDDDRAALQFSVIDTLKPGEFPLDEMESFTTRGVWLLMPMPGATELSTGFEAMYETARAIARYLEGELRDENQSVITAQTVAFSRQRVLEFERRARLYHSH